MKETITGNYFNKYKSKNPLVKFIMGKYFNTLFKCLDDLKFKTVLDMGCGEGEILKVLKDKHPKIKGLGLDIDRHMIKQIKIPDFTFDTKYLDTDSFSVDAYDLVLCLEVLEHIENYELALKNLNKINTKALVISVPNEPFFRLSNLLRLKYIHRWGNTPGHVNNFTITKFKRIIRTHFNNDSIEFYNSWIWNFALIKRKI